MVECKIADFDISDAKEKHKEKFDEIQDIKSHVQGHEEVVHHMYNKVNMVKL